MKILMLIRKILMVRIFLISIRILLANIILYFCQDLSKNMLINV